MVAVIQPKAAESVELEAPRPLLSLASVSKRFASSRQVTVALQDINLEMAPGEFVCIVGPSGCGKTTLLNVVAGLERIDSGRATFAGAAIVRPGPERVVVFQEHALFPWLNVRSNVELGLKIKGVGRQERKRLTDRYLELVNLRSFERAFVHELSGGMKQRVQLARALAVEPRMLLMDEPFAALDAQTRDILQGELQDIWQRTQATILFITHNVREAVILADRVLVMSPQPGTFKREFVVEIPHPRSFDSPHVVELAAEVRAELQHDLFAGSDEESRRGH
jgi:sulfonate transport system ATP-binding protein